MDNDAIDHFHKFSSSVFSTLFYDEKMGSKTPEQQKRMKTLYHEPLKYVCIESGLLDLFPVLEKVPGVASRCRRQGNAFLGYVRQTLGGRMKTVKKCLWWNMVQHISRNRPEGMGDADLPMVLTGLELASHTMTPLTRGTFIVMAALHPDEMRLVQDEMDSVVRLTRILVFTDRDKLP